MRLQEALVSNSDFRDPSLDYPPSRPTWRMLVVALAVVAAAVAIMNWTQVSAFAHLGQVEAEIERVVGL
jgi:hypothetical protein